MIPTIETKSIDKSKWPPGEWRDEPDRKQWQDESTGYPCLIVRGPLGNLCGYVGVKEGHPLYGKDFLTYETEGEGANIDVHWGVSFSDRARGDIFLQMKKGEDYWFIGFDCAHAYDLVPEFLKHRGAAIEGDVYRNFKYVEAEVLSLARQLADIEKKEK